jgi:hypothetical protein
VIQAGQDGALRDDLDMASVMYMTRPLTMAADCSSYM